MKKQKASDVEIYITTFPVQTRKLLNQIRKTIQKAAPAATETINYGIPTFQLHGNLVHYAAFKNHIGFYPGASGIKIFKKKLSVFKNAKGSVQFPLQKPLPIKLITEIVKYRVKENTELFKKKARRICKKGHTYYKSSDCPVCPVCEKEKNNSDFLSALGAPARRALLQNGITSPEKLSKFTKAELLKLHGLGPSSIPIIENILLKKKLYLVLDKK